jgi:histidyl-tRNA synthetase
VSGEQKKTPTRKPQVLKGFRDYMPQQMILRRRIIDIFRGIFERHGFEPLDTPALEYVEVLTGKAGENEKLMYHFEDQGGREVGLRYDLTVPLARVVAMHQDQIVLPFKRYHIAPVWRADKPQRGRFREFWQCDADIVGSASMIADAEAVSIAAEALTAVGLPNFMINISHRRLLEGIAVTSGVDERLAGSVYRAVDKLSRLGASGVLKEFVESGIGEDAGRKVLDAVTRQGSPTDVYQRTPTELLNELRPQMASFAPGLKAINELGELFTVLPGLGVNPATYRLDLSLARGIDYYTGPVYEAMVTEPGVGSVAGAGRYDGLIGNFIGREIPATGMSLGLERILEVVQEFSLLPMPPTVAQIIVPVFPDTIVESAKLASDLRSAGLRVDFSLLPNKSLGDQLKYAGRRGIPFAAIAGITELARDVVAVKNLESGEQIDVPRGDVDSYLSSQLVHTNIS